MLSLLIHLRIYNIIVAPVRPCPKLRVKSSTADGWVVNLQTQVQGKIRVRVHQQSQDE